MTAVSVRRVLVVCVLFPAGVLAACFCTVLGVEGHLWASLAAGGFLLACIVAGWLTDPGRKPERPPALRQRPHPDPAVRALQNVMRRNQAEGVYDWRTEREVAEFMRLVSSHRNVPS